jgi:thiamine biosynthesis lipoprotein
MSEPIQNSTNPNRRQWLMNWRPTASNSADAVDSASLAMPELRDSDEVPLQFFTHRAMACQFQIWFPANRFPQAGQAAMDAFQLIDQLEGQLSIYREDSELSLVNRFARNEWTEVSPLLLQLLMLGQQLSIATQGAFDLTCTPLSRAWSFFDRRPQLIAAEQVAAAREQVGYHLLQIDPERSAVRFHHPKLELNVNSIGKGFAVDRVAELLTSRGIADFLIHGGQSSVLARGSMLADPRCSQSSTSGWAIGLSDPVTPDRRLGLFALSDIALATSGTMRQGFFVGGRRYGHVFDPRTGWPVDHWYSTTVLHPQAARADALATALAVMTPAEVDAFALRHPDIQVITVSRGDTQQRLRVSTWNLPAEQFEPCADKVT